MKKFFSFMALCLMAVGVASATDITFNASTDKGANGSSATTGDKVSKGGITIETTTGNSAFAAGQYRFYKSSVTTFTSTVGPITKVEFTCTVAGTTKYGPGCFSSPSEGTYTYADKVGTWTGSANSFTITASSNQVRATKIVVTVGAADPNFVAAPTFDKAAGTYYQPFTVTITAGTEGSTIHYTTDGTNPTAASPAYSAPVAINATTTLKAVAAKGSNLSEVTSADYVMGTATEVANIAAYQKLEDGTVVRFANPVNVLAQNDKYIYAKDASGYMLVFGNTGKTYKNGDVIPAGFSGKKTTYNGEPELSVYETDNFADASSNTPIEPELIQVSDVNASLFGHYVLIKGATTSYANKTITDNSGSASCYTSMGGFDQKADSVNIDVYAIIGSYRNKTATETTYQVLPVKRDNSGSSTAEGNVDNIAAFNALADNATATFKNPVTVLAQNGQRLFVKDASGYMLVYGSVNQNYKQGDVIPAGFTGIKTTWDGEPELKTPNDFKPATTTETVTAEALTLASGNVSHNNWGHYVLVKSVTIDATASTMTDAAGSVPYFNNMGASIPTDLSKKYDIYAIVGSHGKTGSTVYQLLPVLITEEGGAQVALPEVENLNGLYALAEGTNAKITGTLTAVYQYNSNLYVKDAAGTYGLVYGRLTNKFANGDQITGAVANWKTYNNYKELIPTDSTFSKSGSVAAVEPEEAALEDLSQEMIHQYVLIANATITADSTNYYTVNDGTISMVMFNRLGYTMPTDLAGKKFNVKAFVSLYKGTIQLYPVDMTDVNGGAKGDLNGDGVVNTQDVTALVTAILGGNTEAIYDIDGNGTINTGDVTALVGLALGN